MILLILGIVIGYIIRPYIQNKVNSIIKIIKSN